MTAKDTLNKAAEEKGYSNFMMLFWEGTYDEVEEVALKAMEKYSLNNK